ncbi:MAG TPA: type II toxin-antitoxin system VapC family toxin [Terriglobales bacterium]|nr:type II toxin-antitoxin system VapC family toxin [Terriglobales bacterium]
MAEVFVVDASVAAKWIMPASIEPFAQQADDLFKNYKQGQVELVVPDLFWSELGNILWKGVRRKLISADAADISLQRMTTHNFTTIPSQSVLSRALSIAISFDRSIYDSIYVALAVSQKAQLITADEKLANALAAYFPIKWLGLF